MRRQLVQIRGLSVDFPGSGVMARAVDGVDHPEQALRADALHQRRVGRGGLLAEDEWRPLAGLTAVMGGRIDHHPYAGWVISPRASLSAIREEALKSQK